ncbi:unnamed protein product [Sphenostylis stenocarpa]|uniref:DEK-C domain-containing protein n=1 Tax=Sphenostylis stenocarpa TaxID=92480 RepID=A0AA86S0K8_9FABA|nr:unnamed protein product [Sphenostylis stenocarpa]
MTISVFSVPTPQLCIYKNSWPAAIYPSLSYSSSKLTVPLCSPSPPTSVIEEGASPAPDDIPVVDRSEFTSGCTACGREEIEKGCNGEGRIQGGIATVPGFGWWPIKAYRPCPAFVASGGRYRRQGQSMDEVVSGSGKTPTVRTASDSKTRLFVSEKSAECKMDDSETKQRIEETVRRILQESNMDEVTESKIRKQASEQLGLNLSQPHFKAFVKQVVGAFLEEKLQEQEAQQPQEEEIDEEEVEEEQEVSKGKEYDDEGDLIICKLSDKRRVTIQDFRGKTLVSIREYYKKDGKELPTSKGISLTEEQWSAFKKNLPAIEKAIKKMESR